MHVTPAEQIDGFNAHCFDHGGRDLSWVTVSEWENCALRVFYANLFQYMYGLQGPTIIRLFHRLAPHAQVRFHPGTTLLSDVVTVITPNWSVVVIDGTQNFWQLATQVIYGARPPQNYGVFGTMPLWYNNSTWASNFLRVDGMDANMPIFLCGSSYGAATALVLAGRYRAASPNRQIRYLTFGSPKPGDARLRELLETCEGLSLANECDLVSLLPPDIFNLQAVANALNAPQLFNWILWKRCPNQNILDGTGHYAPSDDDFIDYTTLLNLANAAINNLPLAVQFCHYVEVYAERMALNCQNCVFPIEPGVVAGVANGMLSLKLQDHALGAFNLLFLDRVRGQLQLRGYGHVHGLLRLQTVPVLRGLLRLHSQRHATSRLRLRPQEHATSRLRLRPQDHATSMFRLRYIDYAHGELELRN